MGRGGNGMAEGPMPMPASTSAGLQQGGLACPTPPTVANQGGCGLRPLVVPTTIGPLSTSPTRADLLPSSSATL